MNDAPGEPLELDELLTRVVEERLSAADHARLEQVLLESPAALARYQAYLELHSLLHWSHVSKEEVTLDAKALASRAPVVLSGSLAAWRRGVSYLSQPLHFSVFFAALATISLILFFAQIRFAQNRAAQDELAANRPGAASERERRAATSGEIAQLTAAVECQWAGISLAVNDKLTAGSRLELQLGLAEITFSSGAQVTLEAPAVVTLNSDMALALERGRVAARVPPSAESFTVSTPQLRVVDLGTEFGVFASAEGVTEVHVFQGRVAASPLSGAARGATLELASREAVRFDPQQGLTRLPARPPLFAANLPRGRVARLNLAELVHGGDGLGGPGAGGAIHPGTGAVLPPPVERPGTIVAEDVATYHPVALAAIDGVFIPDPSRGPVVLDSAGHTFKNFPATDGQTWNHLEGGLAGLNPWMRIAGREFDFSAPERSIITLHANCGVTFDLAAIRAATGAEIVSFHAAASNLSTGKADYWVFVDGKLLASDQGVTVAQDAATLDLPLPVDARFLTLVGTDHGDGYRLDQIAFGDPRLRLAFNALAKRATPPRETSQP